MKRSSVVSAFVMMAVLAACGGDDSDSNDTGKKPSSQEKAGSGAEDKGTLPCGSSTCKLPTGVTGELCCRDNFSGTCGVKMGASCRELPKVDERCPVPQLMLRVPMGMGMGMGSAYGCCTGSGECGLDFGSGCQPRSFLCSVVSPDQAEKIKPQKCDGEEIALPANCGMNSIQIPSPGGAGSGS